MPKADEIEIQSVLNGSTQEETIIIKADVSETDDNQDKAVDTEFELPEKFRNAKDPNKELLKAYLELEKSKSTKTDKPNADPSDEASEESEASDDATDKPKELEVDSIPYYQDLWAKQGGNLDDAQWEAVQKKTTIDLETLKAWEKYVKSDMQTALTGHDDKIYSEFGSKAKYDEMIDWASENMSPEAVDALDAYLDSPHFFKTGVTILKAEFNKANGLEPTKGRKVTAEGYDSVGADDFHSDDELIQAQMHPEYGKGGKYDREFMAKARRFVARQAKNR